MPRRRRSWVPGTTYHIVSRFVDREYRIADDGDRERFLHFVGEGAARWDWRIVSYALMSSHVHLGVVAGSEDPQRFFRSVHLRYAQHFHRRYGGLGPVFADRPKTWRVDTRELLRLVTYHHRNPVEAGVVAAAKNSSWTSHRPYIGLAPRPKWLDAGHWLEGMGFADTPRGHVDFDVFVDGFDVSDRGVAPAVEGSEVAVEALMTEEAKSIDDVEWKLLVEEVLTLEGAEPGSLLRSRSHRSARLRARICVEARRRFGASYREIGERFGRSASAVYLMVRNDGARSHETKNTEKY